ncbi:hypothetical protein C6501_17385 [Candidatus Poribacteria bacterium]|nr:MAG: hypothetical protein C6501_17385 [Candidatus Poribacteria bacterium]
MQNSENWSPAFTQHNNNDITTWELPEGATARLGQGRIDQSITPSPDGKYFVVSSDIGVWWYNVSTMTPIDLWDTDRGYISTVSFSPNGKWLATGDGDGLVKVWDVQRGVCISQMERDEAERPYHIVSRLVFSPDSQLLAVSSQRDYILYVWNTETGERIAKFHDNTNYRWLPFLLRPIAFSPDSSLIACTMPDDSLFAHADRGGTIRTPEHSSNYIAVWNIKTGEQITCLTEHPDFVYSLGFSPCGKFLASGGRDGTVRVWSVINWELLHTFQNLGTERKKVFYSPEGVLHALEVSDDAFIVWDVARGEKGNFYLEAHSFLHDAHVPKGTPFVSVSYNPREFRKWTVGDSEPHSFPHLHTAVPFSLVFSPDGKTLAGGCWSENEKVMLWDITQPSTPPSSFSLPGREYIVSVSSHGKIYATGRDNTIAKVWEIGNTETPIATFTLPDEEIPLAEQERQVSTAVFAHKSNKLACGDSEGMLYVWDVQQQHIQHAFKAHDGWINSLAFSPNEKLLLSIRNTGPVSQLWDVESYEAIDTFPKKTYGFAFSPCSTLIAIGKGKEILLWDIEHCETVMNIPQPKDSWNPFALAFSPCGRYLASGAWWIRGFGIKKCAVRLWDVASGENVATFRGGHPTDVQSLAFSPDGTILASGGYDGTILFWDLKPYIDS